MRDEEATKATLWLYWAIVAYGCTTETVQAEGTNTGAHIQYVPIASVRIDMVPHGQDFWHDFRENMWTDTSPGSRLGPLSQLGWFRASQRLDYGIHDRTAQTGYHIFTDVLGDAAGEAILHQLPLDIWRDFGADLGHLMVDFIWGSVGNRNERNLNLVSAEPNEASVTEAWSWWKNARESGDLRFGLRQSYGYVEANIGRQPYEWHTRGAPIVHVDLRCGISMNASDIISARIARVEAQFVFPLPHSCQISLGGSIYPAEENWDKYGPSCSLRLEHLFGTNKRGGIAFIGARSTSQENQIIGGVSLSTETLGRIASRLFNRS